MDCWQVPECRCVYESSRAARTPLLWSAALFTLALAALPGSAQAACATAATTATCTGDEHTGIPFLNGSGIDTINAQALTTPIQPGSGVSGIVLQQFGANAPDLATPATAGDPLTVTTDNSGSIILSGPSVKAFPSPAPAGMAGRSFSSAAAPATV